MPAIFELPSRKIPSAKVCGTLGINHVEGGRWGMPVPQKNVDLMLFFFGGEPYFFESRI